MRHVYCAGSRIFIPLYLRTSPFLQWTLISEAYVNLATERYLAHPSYSVLPNLSVFTLAGSGQNILTHV